MGFGDYTRLPGKVAGRFTEGAEGLVVQSIARKEDYGTICSEYYHNEKYQIRTDKPMSLTPPSLGRASAEAQVTAVRTRIALKILTQFLFRFRAVLPGTKPRVALSPYLEIAPNLFGSALNPAQALVREPPLLPCS